MKIKYFTLFLFSLLIISCSTTIATVKKEYRILPVSQLKPHWNFDSKEWFLEKDTLTGIGGYMHWGVIESKKNLPENYEITFKANMTKGSLFEIMLNIDKEKYIRTYLYQIEQNMVIGRGVYHKKSDEYDKRGGKSLFTKPIELQNNKWYTVKIKVQNNQLLFSVDNNTILECALEKNNLSQQGKVGLITNGEVKITDFVIKNL
ncbi:hypothetical protein OIU80_04805 [Flavobacterium sp. LS1R47]|uniref:3-keto-disaccharide hydrolase domain-containing protein n=1 Tax=Flavobacterium frigoritolerans TaxID=2987686 RepID=A0A9X2ZMZ0_9FLAO|nr:hypothetical protein [Flavobacterium frigoritolerans]MCV9931592.1 hypothetical protein [Flavobacterium frigoritolerans]